MTWWWFREVSIYNPSIVGIGPSKFEIMINHTSFWYMLWLVIYLIISLIVYVIFRARKHEYPLIDTLKISWIWWILIVFVLYNLYMIFVWTCNNCAYALWQDDPMTKLMLLDIWFIVFMVIALIFYFEEIKVKKKIINDKSE